MGSGGSPGTVPDQGVVPGEGIEPSWCCHRGILSPVRLPIPPSRPGAANLNDNRAVRLADFDYELPPELIAQHPVAQRTASRLLHVDGKTGAIEDLSFRDTASLLQAGDVLVVNDTRVIKARLHARKDSGGKAEILVERVLDADRILAQVRASKPLKAGRRLRVGDQDVEVIDRHGEFFELRFVGSDALSAMDCSSPTRTGGWRTCS